MEKIKIGKIVNAVGLKGEVKVYNYSDRRERYEELDRIIVGNKEYSIENVRYQNAMVILKLEGVDDRDGSEALKGKDVYITEEDLVELPEDTYYLRDIIGLDILDFESGEKIGTLADVIQNAAQDIYRIALAEATEEGSKEALVPVVSQFVREVNLEEGYIRIKFIEGMI